MVPLLAGLGLHLAGALRSTATGSRGTLSSKPQDLSNYVIRDCFEDELVPLFALVGKIYELRLMIEFSGTNRTYCYVRYCTENDAKEAVRRLHNYRIRPDYP